MKKTIKRKINMCNVFYTFLLWPMIKYSTISREDEKYRESAKEKKNENNKIRIHMQAHTSTYSQTNNNSCQVEVVLGLFQSLQFGRSQLLKWQWMSTNQKEMDWIWTWMLLLSPFFPFVLSFFLYFFSFYCCCWCCLVYRICRLYSKGSVILIQRQK